jgi:hypothetical protein
MQFFLLFFYYYLKKLFQLHQWIQYQIEATAQLAKWSRISIRSARPVGVCSTTCQPIKLWRKRKADATKTKTSKAKIWQNERFLFFSIFKQSFYYEALHRNAITIPKRFSFTAQEWMNEELISLLFMQAY